MNCALVLSFCDTRRPGRPLFLAETQRNSAARTCRGQIHRLGFPSNADTARGFRTQLDEAVARPCLRCRAKSSHADQRKPGPVTLREDFGRRCLRCRSPRHYRLSSVAFGRREPQVASCAPQKEWRIQVRHHNSRATQFSCGLPCRRGDCLRRGPKAVTAAPEPYSSQRL
jgi:hypothetical protein